jgi:hypothetical protein
VVQAVVRHASITLTMDTYGHTFPGQEADAVVNIPSILGEGAATAEVLRATGTDALLPANCQQSPGKSIQGMANHGERPECISGINERQKVLSRKHLGDKRRD